jgi:hypothetical protein
MSTNVNDLDPIAQASEAAVGLPTANALPDATATLQRLTPAARDLLDVAAVAGLSFRAEDVAEVLGEPVPGILGALREAVRADSWSRATACCPSGVRQSRPRCTRRSPRPSGPPCIGRSVSS